MKLSKPQVELLVEAAKPLGSNAASYYPPLRKCLELGLVRSIPGRFSDRHVVTAAGYDALAALGRLPPGAVRTEEPAPVAGEDAPVTAPAPGGP